MALYEVYRTDDVKPGQFHSAYVIAGGVAQAREACSTFAGVAKGGNNLLAARVELTKGIKLVSVEWNDDDLDTHEPVPYHL